MKLKGRDKTPIHRVRELLKAYDTDDKRQLIREWLCEQEGHDWALYESYSKTCDICFKNIRHGEEGF